MDTQRRRVAWGLLLCLAVLVAGTVGYLLLGLGLLDAAYQTVTTVSTVGFKERGNPTAAYKVFTMVLVLGGVGAVLFTLTTVMEALVEGRLSQEMKGRRMQKSIDELTDHVIVCGWGRVGSTIARHLIGAGRDVVVVEMDPDRVAGMDVPVIAGDATDDDVLRRAGIERAGVLVAAIDTDPENLYVTLTARSLRPDLFIVARARAEAASPKLLQAGANRVVNPQHIGGARMAALAMSPHVADFLDVVMHDGSLEFRLGEVEVQAGSSIAGRTVREAHVRDRTGALILAVRDASGSFRTNPEPDSVLDPGEVVIAVGTGAQLAAFQAIASTAAPA